MNKLIDTIKSKKVKTPIGVLPYDWKVEKLGKFIKIYSGESPSKIKFKGEGIPYYKVDDLNQFDKYMGKSKLIADSHSIKKTVPKNSLIFPKRGAAILTNKVRILTQESYFDTNIMGVEVKEDEINLEFLYYYIVKRGLYKIADTSTIPQLNNKHIEPLLFPKPELKEQKKISEVLSTWDKAIELKEKLIEQKKQQKKGLMQKLLTGEVRLPGYSGEWKKVKLGEILKERKETGYTELELLAITSSKGVVKRTEVDIKDNSSEDKSKYKRILPNDIGYNTMRMWQGVSGVSKYEGIVSPAYTILKPTNKVNSNFIGYLFKLPKIINLFRRYSQGLVSDTLNLKYENLKGIKVTIPQDVEEQKKIAEILLSIDNEIEMLQEYVNYLKQQKKGLMQLLLTGKVRVKV
ncbi:restriction endonuclease subunit S [Heyndrickxia coagulans]|uniref:restriction endonuclease subunit S n=1 Tax=Heyndrickxia coagulans TaxID=1398 RepID=UPI0023E39BE5|nr:restriction endonuclease subunit S [Heyndrickxia coagulans]